MKNISRTISIVFFTFSILLLCYVYYRSNIFSISSYYLKYYAFAFLCILLSLISFFIAKKLKIYITIVFLSILLGLYVAEAYFLIQNNLDLKQKKQDRILTYKNNTGENYDLRTRLQIYKDLKKEDPNIVIKVRPFSFISKKNLNFFPLSGLSNRKTISCNENGYYPVSQSDRYGFNNPDEEWNKNKIEFLLVGDSMTYGSCVNQPDTISGNLRRLNKNENGILGLAQGGNGPLIEYATLREYFPTKKIKRVLWMFYSGNDLEDLAGELNNEILPNYLKDKNFSQNLIIKQQESQKFLMNHLDQQMLKQEKRSLEKRKILDIDIKGFLKLQRVRFITLDTFFPNPAPLKELKNILLSANELVKENNSKLYFIYLPEYRMYSGSSNRWYHWSYWEHGKNSRNHENVIKIAENLEIPVIDITKDFDKHEDPLSLWPFRMWGHYNEKGHQLVGETIFNKINELEK